MSKKIGLALSGGGARGFAHAGVLRALAEYGIRIDLIAGTSAGSLAGGAYAAGMSPTKIEAFSSKLRWADLVRPSISPLGPLSNAPMARFINNEFPVHRFEDLKIPFTAVAYDLENNCEVRLSEKGDLSFAICASCAVPGIFVPLTEKDGRTLVDGGVTSPLPVDAVRAMGADIIIAVDLLACGAVTGRPRTAAGVLLQSAMALLRTASALQHANADIVIEPQVAHIRIDQIKKRDELMALGFEAAMARLVEIRSIINGY